MPYLPACLGSVQKQTYTKYEHIIYDDCSDDKSWKMLRKYAGADSKIKLIKGSKRARCGESYVHLSNKANGDIVIVLDSDDALTKNALETIVRLYDKYPEVGYIWTQHWRCNPNLKKKRDGCSSYPGKGISLLEAGMEKKHCFSHMRTFRCSILKSGQIFPSHLKSAVDKYMGYALEELAVGGFINIPLYKYRQKLTNLAVLYGRRNWQRTTRKFGVKRQEQNIKPYPIYNLEM